MQNKDYFNKKRFWTRDLSGNLFRIEKDNKDQNKISVSMPKKKDTEQLRDFPCFEDQFIVGK